MTHEHRIAQLFDRLDSWRHLPAYQLERRADIFFSFYLHGVVQSELGVELDPLVIPEFPIKHTDNNQSDKADYLLTARDRSRVILVELKTDVRSRRTAQDAYLERAKTLGFRHVLRGLCDIVVNTNAVAKYYHLLANLEQLGFWKLPPDLADYVFPTPRPGLTARLRGIRLCDVEPSVEVLYVQPRADGQSGVIDFDCFARHVASHGDALSLRFAESLRSWSEPAGQHSARVAPCW